MTVSVIPPSRAEKVLAFNGPFMQITIYSCIIAILWFGGNHIIDGHHGNRRADQLHQLCHPDSYEPHDDFYDICEPGSVKSFFFQNYGSPQ